MEFCDNFMDQNFEELLRRLNSLELKLTEQVKTDIDDLKKSWVLPKVDRVTRNAFQLYQVREQLKQSKFLFVKEEQILADFSDVKTMISCEPLDEDGFEATKDTCLFLGTELSEIKRQQQDCSYKIKNLEKTINSNIMCLNFCENDLSLLDLEEVRSFTPLGKREPTPLQNIKYRSREPSPFKMQPLKIPSGRSTPDEFSVLSHQLNLQGCNNEDLTKFKEVFKAKQKLFSDELEILSRPSSALSEMSLDIQDDFCNVIEQPLGDVISEKLIKVDAEISHEESESEQTKESDLKDKSTNMAKEDILKKKRENCKNSTFELEENQVLGAIDFNVDQEISNKDYKNNEKDSNITEKKEYQKESESCYIEISYQNSSTSEDDNFRAPTCEMKNNETSVLRSLTCSAPNKDSLIQEISRDESKNFDGTTILVTENEGCSVEQKSLEEKSEFKKNLNTKEENHEFSLNELDKIQDINFKAPTYEMKNNETSVLRSFTYSASNKDNLCQEKSREESKNFDGTTILVTEIEGYSVEQKSLKEKKKLEKNLKTKEENHKISLSELDEIQEEKNELSLNELDKNQVLETVLLNVDFGKECPKEKEHCLKEITYEKKSALEEIFNSSTCMMENIEAQSSRLPKDANLVCKKGNLNEEKCLEKDKLQKLHRTRILVSEKEESPEEENTYEKKPKRNSCTEARSSRLRNEAHFCKKGNSKKEKCLDKDKFQELDVTADLVSKKEETPEKEVTYDKKPKKTSNIEKNSDSFESTTEMNMSKEEQVPKYTKSDALFHQKTARSLLKNFEKEYLVEQEELPTKADCYKEIKSSPPTVTNKIKNTQRSLNIEIPEKLDVGLCDDKGRNKEQDYFEKGPSETSRVLEHPEYFQETKTSKENQILEEKIFNKFSITKQEEQFCHKKTENKTSEQSNDEKNSKKVSFVEEQNEKKVEKTTLDKSKTFFDSFLYSFFPTFPQSLKNLDPGTTIFRNFSRKKGSDLELKNTITSSDASFFGNKDHEKVEEGKEESLVQKLRTTKKKKKREQDDFDYLFKKDETEEIKKDCQNSSQSSFDWQTLRGNNSLLQKKNIEETFIEKKKDSDSIIEENISKQSEKQHDFISKTYREYAKPEDIQISPRPQRDLFTGSEMIDKSVNKKKGNEVIRRELENSNEFFSKKTIIQKSPRFDDQKKREPDTEGLPQSLNQDILLKSEGFFDRLRSEMKTFQEYIDEKNAYLDNKSENKGRIQDYWDQDENNEYHSFLPDDRTYKNKFEQKTCKYTTTNKKQRLKDKKAWLQNSLMTAVGLCVLMYLQHSTELNHL